MDLDAIYKKYNEDSPRMEEMLDAIAGDHHLHARWINVLSYLEFVGSRKIFKTQQKEIVNEAILRHASDEARHALVLKQMIEKLPVAMLESYDPENLLCGYGGLRYFQSLDSMTKKAIYPLIASGMARKNAAHLCYVYVSFIIEIRANWMYALYARALKKNNSAISVNSIINDEDRHLKDTLAEIQKMDSEQASRINFFIEREMVFFKRFNNSLEAVLALS